MAYDFPTPTMAEGKGDSSVDLLLKAQEGDDDARDQLLARHLPRLQRWTSGRLPWGLRTMLDTGDLVQEAFIKVLPHLNALEIRSEHVLQYYLQQAVKNRIIDLYKRARRRPAREEILEDVPAVGTTPLDAVIGAEALTRYERALASLKKTERHAITLRVELGLSFEEIATHLGKRSADAARMAVTRALMQLADRMDRCRQRGSTGNGI